MSTKTKTDIYETITNSIVAALETGAADPNGWHAPWHVSATSGLPLNVDRKEPYRGVNVWVLLSEQFTHSYSSSWWGTLRQWNERGAVIRTGEHGTKVVLWKPTKRKQTDDNGEETTKKSFYTTSYTVFNADQVDGWEPPVVDTKPFDVIEHARDFFAALGADVRHGGDRAYYTSAADRIQLPLPEDFKTNVDYYATSAHEHTHWTGHESRCNRDLKNRFGSESYSIEELIAELGAAYLCGLLGLANEPRADHAHYIKNWLTVLKNDSKAIVTAASAAQRAVDWMTEHVENRKVVAA